VDKCGQAWTLKEFRLNQLRTILWTLLDGNRPNFQLPGGQNGWGGNREMLDGIWRATGPLVEFKFYLGLTTRAAYRHAALTPATDAFFDILVAARRRAGCTITNAEFYTCPPRASLHTRSRNFGSLRCFQRSFYGWLSDKRKYRRTARQLKPNIISENYRSRSRLEWILFDRRVAIPYIRIKDPCRRIGLGGCDISLGTRCCDRRRFSDRIC
jgi:hypothetical protein